MEKFTLATKSCLHVCDLVSHFGNIGLTWKQKLGHESFI